MQDKNYTNPEDRGRFGFSMSGEYYTPHKAEPLFVALLIGGAVFAALALVYALGKINAQSQMEQESSSAFVMLGSAIALVAFVAILILIFGVGIRSVKKGFRCQYSANDETFTTTIGGDLHVIRYEDVTSVHFEPRSSFGKVRGYDITIMVKGREERYSVCSDGYISQQATPFYIIQERVDLLRQKRSSAPSVINTARANTKAISRAEVDKAQGGGISALDKMSQLLGETSNMPTLSADDSPASRAIARVNEMLNEASDSGGMPAIGKSAKPVNTYVGSDGREVFITDTQTQGSFYVKADSKVTILLTVLGMVVGGGLAYLLWNMLWFFSANVAIYIGKTASTLIGYGFAVAVQPLIVYYMLTHIRGKLHSYKADGRGFFVTTKGGGSEQILYKDVLSVDYKPMKLFGKVYGYKVDILTSYGVVHYDYIFPRFNHKIPRQYLPFEAIRKNMPNKGPEETY